MVVRHNLARCNNVATRHLCTVAIGNAKQMLLRIVWSGFSVDADSSLVHSNVTVDRGKDSAALAKHGELVRAVYQEYIIVAHAKGYVVLVGDVIVLAKNGIGDRSLIVNCCAAANV